MEIISQFKEYEHLEEMYVTDVKVNENLTIRMASYIYDGKLAKDETNPSAWNSDKFDALPETTQKEIRKVVNDSL